jgi:hypothetical protein
MIDRTLHAHEIIIEKVRAAITVTDTSSPFRSSESDLQLREESRPARKSSVQPPPGHVAVSR